VREVSDVKRVGMRDVPERGHCSRLRKRRVLAQALPKCSRSVFRLASSSMSSAVSLRELMSFEV
jgi:hypothetical protein